MAAIGLDVYGTLVDPLAISSTLSLAVGERAEEMATIWRAKQLEYSFRRTLMKAYEDFDVCTRDALRYAAGTMGITLSVIEEQSLMRSYLNLEPYPDVVPGIKKLQQAGYAVVAFSNGVEESLRQLLTNAGVLDHLDGIVSVDTVRTFKPHPIVYRHLADQLGSPRNETWLVSSNYWDVMGARQADLHAAWLRRDPNAVPDPWGIGPNAIIETIGELATHLE